MENYTINAIDIDSMWTGKSEQSSRKKTMYFEGKKVEFLLMNAKFDLSSLCEQIDEYHLRTENVKCRIDSMEGEKNKETPKETE